MNYLVLPSNRLAIYIHDTQKLHVLAVRAEGLTFFVRNGIQCLAIFYQKNLRILSKEDLLNYLKGVNFV
jgi:hypothetical protein